MVYLLLIFLLIILISMIIFIVTSLWTTIIGGVPYLSTNHQRVKEIIALAQVKPNQKVADLGSGDGRLIIAMAEKGAEAHGYELNLFYVLLSKYHIRRKGLSKRAFIHWQNFFKTDVSPFDTITIFGIPYIMKKLEKKLKKEAKAKTQIITTTYSFPTWTPKNKKDHVYLYQK